MKKIRNTLCAASIVALAFVPATASAGGVEPPSCDPYKEQCPPPPPPPVNGKKSKCNSGNGNGSDAITFVEGEHCFGGDPGNSFNAGNKGGDEIPTSGGVPNPGGNNVP